MTSSLYLRLISHYLRFVLIEYFANYVEHIYRAIYQILDTLKMIFYFVYVAFKFHHFRAQL